MHYRSLLVLFSISSLIGCEQSSDNASLLETIRIQTARFISSEPVNPTQDKLEKNCITAKTLLTNCKKSINDKDLQNANLNCPIAEKWLQQDQPESILHAESLESLGDAQALANNLQGATNSYRQALGLYEKLSKASNASTKLQIKLANILTTQSKWAEAEICFKQALRTVKALQGEDSLEVADILNRLAVTQSQQQLLSDAEQAIKQSLAIRETRLTADDPDLGDSYNNIAAIYQSLGKLQDAESYYRKAISTQEMAGEIPYKSLLDSLNNMVTLLYKNDKRQTAEPYIKKMLAISEKGYGKDSPEYANILNFLAIQSIAEQQYSRAENLFGEAFTIREKKLGTNNLKTAESANNLAVSLVKQGKLTQAEPLMRHAFAVTYVILGLSNPLTQERWNSLQNLEKGLSNRTEKTTQQTNIAPIEPRKNLPSSYYKYKNIQNSKTHP